MTWYDANEFLCELGKLTNKQYRLPTEAEWEFAAKGGKDGDHTLRYSGNNDHNAVAVSGSVANVKTKAPNNLGLYDMSGNIEEWTYDSWETNYPTGNAVNPIIGVNAHIHTQKTRRGGHSGELDPTREVLSRRIRSIDGSDGSLGMRIALSGAINTVPAGMRLACNINLPKANDNAVKNGWRDMRWVTNDRGSDSMWTSGTGFGSITLRIWEDGTALHGTTAGQWYTVNNMILKFVANSNGNRTRFPYIFVDEFDPSVSIINSTAQFTSVPRIRKVPSTGSFTKPTTITPLNQLTTDPEDVMIDFSNINTLTQHHDSKTDHPLINGTTQAWWLDGAAIQATHRYLKDVKDNTFEFYVYMPGTTTLLAGGSSGSSWFTVNNTFLRVRHSGGYTTDYIYTVNATRTNFTHVSYQAYERGDFRGFTKTNWSSITAWPPAPPAQCWPTQNPCPAIPATSAYANHSHGHSTFVPPEMP
jgi:hypothetical protein